MKLIDADVLIDEIERRLKLLENGEANIEVMKRVEGVIEGYLEIISTINSMQEEPVSKDLEEEIHKEVLKLHTAPCYDELAKFAEHFVKWGKNHNDELGEEIERWVYKKYFGLNGTEVMGTTHYLTVEDVADIARYFAKWGKEQAEKEAQEAVSDDLEVAADNCYFRNHGYARESFIEGANWQKQQMMKEAAEAECLLLPPTDL